MSKVLNLTQMIALLNRTDKKSVRITVKVSKKTLAIIELLQMEFDGYKFNEFFTQIMAAFLNLLDQLKNNQKAEIADMLKINSDDSRLDSQKTFVISSNTKRVLDELSELFEARNRSSVFNWLLAACFEIIRLNNEKNWKNNLQIYHNALELGNKLYTTIEETESKITNLFDKHDPPLKDLIPELNSSNPVEHFLAEIETTSITLSNSLGTLEELIQDCQKKIALAERIDRLNKSQQENI